MRDWAASSLAAVAEIGAGNSAPQDERLFKNGVHPFIRTSDVGQIRFGSISTAADLLNEEGIEGLRLFPKGTILMPKSGASTFLNHRVEMSEDGYVSSHLATVHARPSVCDSRFLLYYLSTIRAQDLIQDHKYPSLTLGTIGEIPVPLPPLDEQKRIVAVLDQAFAALDRVRGNAEANLADAEKLFASELEDMFARKGAYWTRRMLSSVGTLMTGSTPKTSEPGNFGDEVPFITPGDFRADGSLDTDNRGLSKQGAAKARLIPSGSALMVCIGATIGKAGFTTEEIVTNQQINAISPHKDVSGEFLYFQFLTPRFQKALTRRAGQATLPIISKGKWGELEVHMPPSLSMQVEVVMKMREVRIHTAQLQTSYNAKLADIAALRHSLLQAAFSGQLT